MFEETLKLVQSIYIAYYGRPADSDGLTYWANRIDSEGLEVIIEAFATSAESVALYGDLETREHITTIYQQLFSREPDAEGLAFYSARIASGELTPATVMLDIINGARNEDRQIIDNKRAIAETFTNQVTEQDLAYSGAGAAGVARLLIDQVNADTTPQDLSTLTQLAAEVTDLASTNQVLFDALIPSGGEVGDLLDSLPEGASAEDLLNIIDPVVTAALDDPAALDSLIAAGGGSFESTLEALGDRASNLAEILSAANENGAQELEELLDDTATGGGTFPPPLPPVIPANQAPIGEVIITGNLTQNAVLTAVTRIADDDGLSYQWNQRDTADGPDTPITDNATEATYTLTQADVGKFITVTVRYTDGGNTAESVTSRATATPATAPIAASDPATLSITGPNGTVAEGEMATFTVTLSSSPGAAVVVHYAASVAAARGDTAATDDFTATSGSLIFLASASGNDALTRTIMVPVLTDMLTEGDETFRVTLSEPSTGFPAGVSLSANDTATATIAAADTTTIAISGPSSNVAEGEMATFTVTLSSSPGAEVMVNYATSVESSDTAATNDFADTNGILTFVAGASGVNLTQTITVPVLTDTLTEGDETFSVTLSEPTAGLPAGVSLSADDTTATATIAAAGTTTIAITGPSSNVAEGSDASFTVTLTGSPGAEVMVNYATSVESGDTAAASDFTDTSGTLTFAAGASGNDALTRTIMVPVLTDMLTEGDETFTVTLSAPTVGFPEGVTIGTASAIATIAANDNDTVAPVLTSSSPADNAMDVAPDSNISLHFDSAVKLNTSASNILSGNIITIISDTEGIDVRTIDVTGHDGQLSINDDGDNTVLTINPNENLHGNTAYSVIIGTEAITDLAGNPYAGISETTTTMLNFKTAIDTSTVVFDLTTGLSSDHSGQAFSANISYTLYIKVHSNSVDINLNDGESWSDASNLSSDDQVILVGTGADILDENGNSIAGSRQTSTRYIWGLISAPAAGLDANGEFDRFFSGEEGNVELWSGVLKIGSQGYRTALPASVSLPL